MNITDFQIMEESEDVRYIQVDDNQKIWFKREGPFSFWKVNFNKGRIPKKLSGMFTDFDKAYNAVSNYLKNDYPASQMKYAVQKNRGQK